MSEGSGVFASPEFFTASSPNLSYIPFFFSSESTPYAKDISLNFASASVLLFGFLSGCHLIASFLYAFFIALLSASLDTPKIS